MRNSSLLLFVVSACAFGQQVITQPPLQEFVLYANAGSTGTTINHLAKLTGAPSTVVIFGTADTSGVIGVVYGGAGTTGNAMIQVGGKAQCVFDGATTAGHWVTSSTSTAGDCHDEGIASSAAPTGGIPLIGVVTSTNGGAGTYTVDMSFGSSIGGGGPPSGAAGGSLAGTYPNPAIANSVSLPVNPTTTTQAASDNSTRVATTAYVTAGIANAIAGVNPAVAVQAATTTVLPAVTYSNGVAGIGATLTQNSAAVLVVDGYTVLLGDRLLVKNQASGFQNGVYTVGTLGTGVIPFVLIRALDYDMPSDINNTGAIPVVNGTTNALTSWLLTSTVTTVGTDALTYTQFSYKPTTTFTPSIFGGATLTPDVTGNALFQPLIGIASISASTFFNQTVLTFAASATSCVYGSFTVPGNYQATTTAFLIDFASTDNNSSHVFQGGIDYTVFSATTSIQATTSASGQLTGTQTTSATAGRISTVSISATASDFSANAYVQYKACQVVTSTTLTALAIVPNIRFSYVGTQ